MTAAVSTPATWEMKLSEINDSLKEPTRYLEKGCSAIGF